MARSNMPTALPGGALVPFMNARRFAEISSTVFEMCGGVERLAHEADKDFKWFMEKVYVKAQPRNINMEQSTTGIEELLDKVQKVRDEGIIDITPRDVEHAD